MQGDRARASEARKLVLDRDRRYGFFPSEIFDEFAWNMLLHLFIALVDNEIMSEGRLFRLSRTSELVGRRWVGHLVADGQVEARDDGSDIILTHNAIRRMRDYLGMSELEPRYGGSA